MFVNPSSTGDSKQDKKLATTEALTWYLHSIVEFHRIYFIKSK